MPRRSVEDTMMLMVKGYGVPVSLLLDGHQWRAFMHPPELEEGVAGIGSGPAQALLSLQKKINRAMKEKPASATADES